MSFRLYVGNYPKEFSKKDVEHIFRDFDGIILEKIFKQEKKCFSFLICKDIDQLVSVIRKKNNAFVCGRQLKVRASDEGLQDYVNLLLKETNDDFKSDVETPSLVPLQVMRNCAVKQKYKNDTVEKLDKSSGYISTPLLRSNADEHNSSGSGYSNEFNSMSPVNDAVEKSPVKQYDEEMLTWVSVTNFPLGTSIRSIYKLFEDYDPLDVKMICNYPRQDRALTEAHVCFWNKDIADDVIMNFDNTMYNGRLILVNDVQDLTIMNELLAVHS